MDNNVSVICKPLNISLNNHCFLIQKTLPLLKKLGQITRELWICSIIPFSRQMGFNYIPSESNYVKPRALWECDFKSKILLSLLYCAWLFIQNLLINYWRICSTFFVLISNLECSFSKYGYNQLMNIVFNIRKKKYCMSRSIDRHFAGRISAHDLSHLPLLESFRCVQWIFIAGSVMILFSWTTPTLVW